MENTNDDNFRARRTRSFREKATDKNGENNLRRVRSFKTTSKGLVNRGDSFKCRKTADTSGVGYNHHLYADNADNGTIEPAIKNEYTIPQVTMTRSEDVSPRFYRVLTLGTEGVGKSSIIDQFMTSEFLGSGTFNISQCEGEHTVTLQVDGEESTLEFLQAEDFQENVENLALDGFIVVYSITDRDSFDTAVEVMTQLREEVGPYKAIILVGNKTDLVRKRTVTADEGRNAADSYGCKYIETSAALNHRVDDLLVGIHKQITLKGEQGLDLGADDSSNKILPKTKPRKSSFKRTKRFIEKIFLGNSGKKDKQTENLYVD